MAKLTLNNIQGQFASTTELNSNFDLIETALENTVSRDGSSPNTMSADLDLNSQDINNTNVVNAVAVKVSGVSIVPGDTLTVPAAANVPNTPAGNIVATDVQAAINELDTEKVGIAGTETVTGDKTFSGANTHSGDNTLSGNNLYTGIQTLNGASPLVFEGVIDDAFETTLAITDPTADRTLTVQDKTGTIVLNDDVSKIESIIGTVASNALTAGLNPTDLNFRSSTLTDGVPVSRQISSALSLVVPSGATLGTVDTIQSRLILLAIDNAGTVELAIVNLVGGNNLDETTLISTTAIDATADSDNVIYSTTARSNVAFRVVGYIESTQATAGIWDTAPSTLQGMGGNALTAMGSIGYGQTWQSVTRNTGTVYYNTTGKPIYLSARMAASSSLTMNIGGEGFTAVAVPAASSQEQGFIVPPNSAYSATYTGTLTFKELR